MGSTLICYWLVLFGLTLYASALDFLFSNVDSRVNSASRPHSYQKLYDESNDHQLTNAIAFEHDQQNCGYRREEICQGWSLDSSKLRHLQGWSTTLRFELEIEPQNVEHCQNSVCLIVLEILGKRLFEEKIFQQSREDLLSLDLSESIAAILELESNPLSGKLVLKFLIRRGYERAALAAVMQPPKLRISARSLGKPRRAKRNTSCNNGCCLEHIQISARELNQAGILDPTSFSVGVCNGTCVTRGTRYENLDSLLNRPASQCAPVRWDPVQIVYVTDDGLIGADQLNRLSAAECSCYP